MNYIKQLQEENQKLKKQLDEINKAVNEFRAFLATSKFQGVESNGDRKDWISTGDVNERLREFVNMTLFYR